MKSKKLVRVSIALMLVLITVVLTAVSSGCSSDTETGESQDEHDAAGEVSEGEYW